MLLIYASLAKLVQSRWLDISRIPFCVSTRKKQTNKQTRERGQYLDILTEQAWSKKDFLCSKKITLYWVRVKNYFLTSRATGKKSNIFVAHETHESSFFVSTVFCRFLRLRHRHCPKITNLLGLQHEIFSKAHLAYSLTSLTKLTRESDSVRSINSLNLECDHKDKLFLWGTPH